MKVKKMPDYRLHDIIAKAQKATWEACTKYGAPFPNTPIAAANTRANDEAKAETKELLLNIVKEARDKSLPLAYIEDTVKKL